MKTKIAINGLGRIGRAFLKLALKEPSVEVVAVNDLGDVENLKYLLKYDSTYGHADIDLSNIKFLQIKDPATLPWKELGIDVVVESTGVFDDYQKASAHVAAGAKRVVISAPAKGDPGSNGATVLMGVNEDKLKTCQVSSNASCTTNAASPVLAIMDEALGIEAALLNTVHAYTATQKLVDSPDARDWRRGRAAGANIVPSTTGAASAVTAALPDLENKFDGLAIRVPVLTGSLVDLTFWAKRETSVEEVNKILTKAASEPRWRSILEVTNEPLVSSDIIGNTHGAIVDLALTKVISGKLVKVMSWYDNEMGYASTLLKHVVAASKS